MTIIEIVLRKNVKGVGCQIFYLHSDLHNGASLLKNSKKYVFKILGFYLNKIFFFPQKNN